MATSSMTQPRASSGNPSEIIRQIAVVVGFVGVIVGNSLAEAIPINNQTSAAISNALPILITPANYAFAIWGLIWIGLGAFAVYQALPAQRGNPLMQKITPWFLLSCFLNVFWLVTFHFNWFVLSCFVIAGLAASLVVIYVQLGIGRRSVSLVERLCTHVPFSLYLGWVCVATIVNIAYTLYKSGFQPDFATQEAFTVMMLVIASVLGTIFAVRNKEIALIGVFVWAFTAIGNARGVGTTTPVSPTVQAAAFGLSVCLVIIVVIVQIMANRAPAPVVTGRRKIV